jgi:hypothetical protein
MAVLFGERERTTTMRINVYREELTSEVSVFRTEARTGEVYTGVRLYLQSPDTLHFSEDDDDRSAITFFVKDAEERKMLSEVLTQMARDLTF